MQVNNISNFSTGNRAQSFQARIKISPNEISDAVASATASGSMMGSSSGAALSASATTCAGSASDVLGTAFSSHASGLNSSGIVPSYMQHAASSFTPPVLEATNANPSLAGSVFTTLGRIFGMKIKSSTKHPS